MVLLVYLANLLAHEKEAFEAGSAPPVYDMALLEEAGVADKLEGLGKMVISSRLTKPLCSLLPLPGEMFAMTSGADTTQIVIYDPKEQDKQFRWLLSPQEMSVAPGPLPAGC